MKAQSDMPVLLRTMLPLFIWFACFSLLYGIVTLACTKGLPEGTARYASIGIVAITTLALGALVLREPASGQFMSVVTRGLSFLALLATAWLLAPLLLVKAC